MEQTGLSALKQRIRQLNEAELAQVYSRIFEMINTDAEPILTEEELRAQTEQDQNFLLQVADELKLQPGAVQSPASQRDNEVRLLETLLDQVPEMRQPIADAVAALDIKEVPLDFGITAFAASFFVISLAVAAIKPRLVYKEKKKGDSSEKYFEFQVKGVDNIAEVVKAAFPFLGKK